MCFLVKNTSCISNVEQLSKNIRRTQKCVKVVSFLFLVVYQQIIIHSRFSVNLGQRKIKPI